jgi:hypothetical protein
MNYVKLVVGKLIKVSICGNGWVVVSGLMIASLLGYTLMR